jgi:hypothetical protein
MRRQWCAEKDAFLCAYTGVPLIETPDHTRYATWEHRDPADESSVVLVADVVNRMRGDMTEAEFERLVIALARHFEGRLDESAVPDRLRRSGAVAREPPSP